MSTLVPETDPQKSVELSVSADEEKRSILFSRGRCNRIVGKCETTEESKKCVKCFKIVFNSLPLFFAGKRD